MHVLGGNRDAERGLAHGIPLVIIAVLLTALAMVGAATAWADGPFLAIEHPESGSVLRERSPTFAGVTSEPCDPFDLENPVTLEIEDSSKQVKRLAASETSECGSHWSVTSEALADGSYVARATQIESWPGHSEGSSEPVSFTIDSTPPNVTLTAPANGSSTGGTSITASGAAGAAGGSSPDSPNVSVALFAGTSTGSQPQETQVVQRTGETWSATFGGLSPGTYTLQATQSDDVGNTGTSSAATFTVTPAPAPPAPAGPAASFVWVPTSPAVGENVSLVSNSTDLASQITSFAWSLSPTAAFSPGSSLLTTSFSTPGAHSVRLRVGDAAGRSSTATETVPVKPQTSPPMSPFPIVRLAGSLTARGARIKLLTVQAPLSALVSIRCRGNGCRTKSESRTARASSHAKLKPGSVLLSFGRFERSYGAHAKLEVSVVKAGQIGKFTTFLIRRHKPPLRTDACLLALGGKPFPCTSA
jgi:PKD domain